MNQTYRLNPGAQITNVSETPDEKPQFLAIDSTGGEKYELGEEEMFLLQQLHDQSSTAEMAKEFQSHFKLNLSPEALDNFISQMVDIGLLQLVAAHAAAPAAGA